MKSIVFLVVVDQHGSRFVVLSSLHFASIALFPKRKVEVVAVQTHPIAFSRLGSCLGKPQIVDSDIFDRSEEGFHRDYFKL